MYDRDWMRHAACGNHPLGREAWEPKSVALSPANRAAIDVCRRDCPVVVECARYAIRHRSHSVIVAGLHVGLHSRRDSVDRRLRLIAGDEIER